MKKIKSLIYAGIAASALAACSDEAPDSVLTVTVDGAECKAGVPVCFKIDGKADNIVFYSGEPGPRIIRPAYKTISRRTPYVPLVERC